MRYLCLLSVMLFLACKQPESTPDHPDLKIQWELVANRLEGQDRWLSHLGLINTSENTVANNWELFFSFSPGRGIDTEAVKENGYEVKHWAGDHYSLKPGEDTGMIPAGDTLLIELPATGAIIKNSDAPGGFYLVFDGDDEAVYRPEVYKKPIGDEVALYIGSTRVLPPDPSDMYALYDSMTEMEESGLSPVTPEPLQWSFGEGVFSLNDKTAIHFDQALRGEAEVLQTLMEEEAGLSPEAGAGAPGVGTIFLGLAERLMPEEYELEITESRVDLLGGSPAAVFYGIQSMRALLVKDGEQVSLKSIAVKDKPAFDYRGMHLDVARNFSSKETVLKLLDLMGYYKLNTFHFHITDDEGWRLEIPGLPELTTVGSKRIHTRDEQDGLFHQYGSASTQSGSGFYSRSDYMEILKYAAQRHIEVIPEIDLPGHARAAIVAMKAREGRLLKEGDSTAAARYILHDKGDRSEYFSVQNFSDNVINVCLPSTYTFIEKVVEEMQLMHSEAGNDLKTLHIGGDEVPYGVWQKSAACMEMFPESDDLAGSAKQYFIESVGAILGEKGIRMAGWEEVGLYHKKEGKAINTELTGENAPLLYHWHNSTPEAAHLGEELAEAGYPVILSHVTNLYFDMAYTASPEEPGFYWGGFVDTKKVFEFTAPENVKNIKGIQGQLWSEVVHSADELEYMVFPKLIALAERAWKGNIENSGQQQWDNFANRLGQYELDRLDGWYGEGVSYRLPSPGGFVKNDTLYLKAAYPGMELRYETGGLPSQSSSLYSTPVPVKGEVKAAAFRPSGRASKPVTIPVISSE